METSMVVDFQILQKINGEYIPISNKEAKAVLVSREVRRALVVATARNYESEKKSKKKYVLLKGD